MYLVDTNVWLERLLDQERSWEVGRFLDRISSDQLFITDFAFHSMGIVLSRLNCAGAFLQFVRDADFDDAYQYVVAERNGLTIVSFDGDFDRTEEGARCRKTPWRDRVAQLKLSRGLLACNTPLDLLDCLRREETPLRGR